jgi:hypothetical protein
MLLNAVNGLRVGHFRHQKYQRMLTAWPLLIGFGGSLDESGDSWQRFYGERLSAGMADESEILFSLRTWTSRDLPVLPAVRLAHCARWAILRFLFAPLAANRTNTTTLQTSISPVALGFAGNEFNRPKTWKDRPDMGFVKFRNVVVLILCVVIGYFGMHRFYVGRVVSGILWLLTGGLLGIGWFIDIILIATGHFRDSYGRPVLDWDW